MSYCTPATYLDMGQTMADSNQEKLLFGQVSEGGKQGLDTNEINVVYAQRCYLMCDSIPSSSSIEE